MNIRQRKFEAWVSPLLQEVGEPLMHEIAGTKRLGHVAGVTYLVMIVSAALGYTTMTRLLTGDTSNVLARILGGSTFHLAFTSMAAGFVAWVILAILLYRLMQSSGRLAATLLLLFTLAGAVTNLVAMGRLLPLFGSSGSELDAVALVQMTGSYEHLLVWAQIFSGLWMFPFGWLVLRSGIAPRFLGYCLMVGGVGYLFIPLTKFYPDLDHHLAYWIVSRAPGIPAMLGEIGICLWLLVKGVRIREPAT
jgi:hypothetical protein